MYFKQKSNTIFRDYGSFGYITDNRNFGYKQANDDDIGDKIVSQSGAVFLSCLGKKPQTLESLAKKISMKFANVDINTIKDDAREFYLQLELDGFIVSGDTFQECNKKDVGFSYNKVNPNKEIVELSTNRIPEKSTKEFLDGHYKGEPQLTNIHIEITSNCNERCVHCYIPHENKIGSIDSDLFHNILDQCKEMNLLHLTISGGEPMTHSNFIEFLNKCNEYNFSVNILSNLTLINKVIIKEMKRNHLLGVQTSLYSMNANIHDSITQTKGSFEKTRNAILALIKNDIPLQISCPVMKQNKNCYCDVVNWGKAHGIEVSSDYVIIGRYNHTTQNLINRLSVSEIKDIIEHKIVQEPHYIKLLENEAEKKKDMKLDDYICSVCQSSICISENGNVYPCAGWQDYTLGNIRKTSLSEIWSRSKEVQYLRNLRRRDFPKCIECPDNEFCTMCMVRNANEHPQGNPLAINEYFCNIAELQRNLVLNQKYKP